MNVVGQREASGGSTTATSRRLQGDRRTRPTRMFSRYAVLGGRRRGGRRAGETDNIYVDRHGPLLLFGALALALLNVLDAFFTMLFLSHGGQELNPLIDSMLGLGLWPFLLTKTIGVGICVAFLVMTKTFAAARVGLIVLLTGYTALLGWHLWLLTCLDG